MVGDLLANNAENIEMAASFLKCGFIDTQLRKWPFKNFLLVDGTRITVAMLGENNTIYLKHC